MKLRILSDLHLEFDSGWILRHRGEDAVLCAGDLGNCVTRVETERLIRSSQVPFYFILGNHDFYHGEVGEVIDYYRQLGRRLKHFHFLHNETARLGGHLLAGTPLWTDFALYGPDTVERSIAVAERAINDFSEIIRIRSEASKALEVLRAQHLVDWHREARRFLEKTIAEGKPTIIMTHWCPSAETISSRYAEGDWNPYFTTECRDLMGGNVALWVHGHSHMADDRSILGTRVIRNPKGYPHEQSGWREDLIVTV